MPFPHYEVYSLSAGLVGQWRLCVYRQYCVQTANEELTQRRVGDIIGEFDMSGIINAKVVSQGRYGRTREINLLVPQQLIDKIKKIIYSSLGLE